MKLRPARLFARTAVRPPAAPPPPPTFLQRVSGTATISLFKGKASIVARSSTMSLYNQNLSSMDEQGAWNPADSTGFIRINAVRLKAHFMREQSLQQRKLQ